MTNGASVAALWVGGAFAIRAVEVAGHHIRIDAGGELAIIDHPTGAAVAWGTAQDLFFTLLSVFCGGLRDPAGGQLPPRQRRAAPAAEVAGQRDSGLRGLRAGQRRAEQPLRDLASDR